MAGWAWIAIVSVAGVVSVASVLVTLLALAGNRSRGRKRCPKCWYSMEGLEALTCPECGHTARRGAHLYKTRRRWRLAALALVALMACLGGVAYWGSDGDGWLRAMPTWALIALTGEPDYQMARANNANLAPNPALPFIGRVGGPTGQAPPTPPTPPPPANRPIWEGFFGRLHTELARRHLTGKLTKDQTLALARRAMPALTKPTLDGFVWAREEWLDGAEYLVYDLTRFERSLTHAEHFPMSVRIYEGQTEITPRVQYQRHRDGLPRFAITEPTRLRFVITLSDVHAAHGTLWTGTFNRTVVPRDRITDILDPLDAREIEQLKRDHLHITYDPMYGYELSLEGSSGEHNPPAARQSDASAQLPNLLWRCRLTRAEGKSVGGALPLCKGCFVGWPKVHLAGPDLDPELDGPDGPASFRLVNDVGRLLYDPRMQRCLPEEGLIVEYREVIRERPSSEDIDRDQADDDRDGRERDPGL